MYCNIADLIVDVPAVGGMAPRCRDYEIRGNQEEIVADIVIRDDLYHYDRYPGWAGYDAAYMESGLQFCRGLLRFNGLYLHASAVELDGRAYLFSGPCGTGKSTHTRIWQQVFGDKARVFNDDKPALRRLDGRWYAYGTPWCGKDGININRKVPLVGICFLKQAPENHIRRLSSIEAVQKILPQTIYRFYKVERQDLLLESLDKLVREIPIFELENRPEPEAALLSYETMRRAAEEAGL